MPLVCPQCGSDKIRSGSLHAHDGVRHLLLDTPLRAVEFQISWEWLNTELHRVWRPFLLGSFLVGSVCAALGFFGIRGLWRWHVIRDWEKRKKKRNGSVI